MKIATTVPNVGVTSAEKNMRANEIIRETDPRMGKGGNINQGRKEKEAQLEREHQEWLKSLSQTGQNLKTFKSWSYLNKDIGREGEGIDPEGWAPMSTFSPEEWGRQLSTYAGKQLVKKLRDPDALRSWRDDEIRKWKEKGSNEDKKNWWHEIGDDEIDQLYTVYQNAPQHVRDRYDPPKVHTAPGLPF